MLGHDAWVYRYIRLVFPVRRNIPEISEVTILEITNKFKGVYFSLNFFEKTTWIDQHITADNISIFP